MPMAFSEHNKAVSGYICAQEIMICIVLIRLHFLLPCKQVMKGYVKHLSYTHPNWTQAGSTSGSHWDDEGLWTCSGKAGR